MTSISFLFRSFVISLGITLCSLPGQALLGAKQATAEEIGNISRAIPEGIMPRKKHKVLVISKAFTYYHSSIAVAKEMAKQMGEKTGLFDADFTDDPKDLNGKGYRRFYSMVGHNDGGRDTYLTFEVHVDDRKVFDSGNMTKGDKAKPVDISVQGANSLKLIVTNGQDGKPEGDHADWGYAFLVK